MCFNKGDRVRWNYNNAIGEVTGRVIGSRINVKFNEGEYRYIESQNLELVPSDECIFSRFDNRAFSGIDDYRRALNRYRLSGGLTDIMYSMSNARTEFFPHQFLPVTKFLESFTGRLLIADEVGLGKTIEAMYIWEELRARSNARKLLIVAPAVLRMKWKNDLERFFNIDATIVRAQGGNGGETLLGRLKHLVSHPGRDSFVYIVSLEGLRTSRDLESLLEDSAEVRSLFDLVIIDEAHYMRNSGTRSFKFGARLRDVSEHLLLLSATPIQTSSDNFYNLLRLLGPEEFDSQILFETRLNDLIPVVKLTNALEAGAQEAVVRQMLDIVCVMPAFALDADCRYLKSHLEEVLGDTAKRVWMIKRLKGKFFYDQYVTRTRKRDVMENRTVRRACAVQFALTQVEREMYWRVTDFLSSRDPGDSGFSVFRLIIRQRQMASCMPAALMAWRGQEVRQSASMSDAEYVDGERESLLDDVLGDVRCDDADDFVMPTFDEIDLNQLVASDSKFNAILGQLQDILSENAGEKIVIFTFFRGTVAYLYDRLKAAGISVEYLIGGMPSDEKTQRIERFRDCGVSVLVSSEVGSEGIDLQFARHEINYDLPWNPMRLEQRIGRIDRIGQKSPEIFIYNAFCESTIEDRILNRLYGRIERFRSIIGDLEEILGNVVQSLEIDVFRKRKMSDAEIDAKLRQIDQAVENRRMMSQELEKDAGYLTAYQRHVLDNIKRARTNVRRLTPKETLNTVKSFLNANYPGSSVRAEDGDGMTTICLSDAARASLTKYLEDNPQPSGTRLNYSRDGVLCDFDNSRFVKESRIVEKIDVNHPLMKWILTELNRDISTLSGCELLRVGRCFLENASEIPSGSYFYYVQNWQVDGIRRINELHYYVASVESGESLGPDLSERLMIAALLNGDTRDVGSLGDEEFARAQEVLQVCVEGAFEEFDRFVDDQKSQNVNLVAQQKLYVEQTTSKKLEKFKDTIGKLVADGKSSAAKMWKGKMDKVLQDKNARLARLEEVLQGQATASDVATGIITVEDV